MQDQQPLITPTVQTQPVQKGQYNLGRLFRGPASGYRKLINVLKYVVYIGAFVYMLLMIVKLYVCAFTAYDEMLFFLAANIPLILYGPICLAVVVGLTYIPYEKIREMSIVGSAVTEDTVSTGVGIFGVLISVIVLVADFFYFIVTIVWYSYGWLQGIPPSGLGVPPWIGIIMIIVLAVCWIVAFAMIVCFAVIVLASLIAELKERGLLMTKEFIGITVDKNSTMFEGIVNWLDPPENQRRYQ
jgi:hypothetical protein